MILKCQIFYGLNYPNLYGIRYEYNEVDNEEGVEISKKVSPWFMDVPFRGNLNMFGRLRIHMLVLFCKTLHHTYA